MAAARRMLLPSSMLVVSAARRMLLPPSMRGLVISATHQLARYSKETTARRISQELTEVERQVLLWLSNGKRFGDIALIMNITPNAAHQCVHRIKNKLGCNTSAGAVAKALRSGLIE